MSAVLLHAMFGIGGGLGAVMRHGLSRLIDHRYPLATLLVNALGSFVLGAVLASSDDGGASGTMARQAMLGFCGGFTTFSSFAVQSLALYERHSAVHLLANVAINLTSCLLALAAGAKLLG